MLNLISRLGELLKPKPPVVVVNVYFIQSPNGFEVVRSNENSEAPKSLAVSA